MITKITHFTLFVNDQDKALKFYTEKLGFKIHTDAPMGEMRWLTLNLPNQKDVELVLMKAEDAQEKALVGKQGGNKPLFCIESSDCKKDYETLSKNGVKFLDKPQEQPWGISVSLQDPDGNVLYMNQPK